MATISETPLKDRPHKLEWMLQSKQVSDKELISVLLENYYEIGWRTALDRFSDPQIARQAVFQVLTVVVANRDQYWGDIPIEDWLNKLTSITFQQLDKKGNRYQHQSPIVYLDISDNIKYIAEVEKSANQLRQKRQIAKFIPIASLLGAIILLVAGILLWIATPETDPTYIPPDQVRSFYVYVVQPGDNLESIAQNMGVSIDAIKALNPAINFMSVQEMSESGAYLKLPTNPPRISFLERLQSKLPRFHPFRPLNVQSSPDAIKQRILKSSTYWSTIQADFWITFYDVPGHFGLSQQVHEQVWMRKPDQVRMLGFNPDNSVSFAEFSDDNRHYTIDPSTNEVFLDFDTSYVQIMSNQLDIDLHNDEKGTIKILGSEKVASRDALVVDWYNAKGQHTYRLWIDHSLGVILAWRKYGGGDYQSIVSDMVMINVQVNENIDDKVFNPSRGVFITFPSGPDTQPTTLLFTPSLKLAPAPTPPQGHFSPPPDFDLTKSRIALVTPIEQAIGEKYQIRVFGDDYYLGSIDFSVEQTFFETCSRSPNGQLVAFTIFSQDLSWPTGLYWFRLNDLSKIHSVCGAVEKDFACFGFFGFSPDSNRLAFHACESSQDYCGIYILDLSTGHIDKLVDKSYSYQFPLVWSPDGGELAFVEAPNGPQKPFEFKVYKVSSAQLLYSGLFDDRKLLPATDAPVQDWGVDFSELMSNDKGCATP